MAATPEKAWELLSRHGNCTPQDATDWTGTIPLPEPITAFYRDVGPLNIEVVGYGNPSFIPSLATLWDHQAGYRWDGVSGAPIEDWNPDWFVVADEGADPYIFDATTGRILFAQHGYGEWDAGEIYPDLNTMAACIAALGTVILDSDEFTDDDEMIKPECRERAIALLTEIIGDKIEAEVIVETAGWG